MYWVMMLTSSILRTTIDVDRYLYTLNKTSVRAKSDQTLEVIMTHLDPEIMKIFYQEYTSSASEATRVSRSSFYLSLSSSTSTSRNPESIKSFRTRKSSIICSIRAGIR
jgi:hypothetical protein